MIRLFVGLELPDDIKDHIYSLRGGIPSTRWINRDNLHLTLRFLGNVEESHAHDIHDELTRVSFYPFDLAITQIGFFTQGNQPKHLWAGVNNYHVLDDLHGRIEAACIRAGRQPSDRKFHAHTTIAKFKGANWDKIQEFISYHNLFSTRTFRTDHFTLFSSHPHHNGTESYYRVEATYPFEEYPR